MCRNLVSKTPGGHQMVSKWGKKQPSGHQMVFRRKNKNQLMAIKWFFVDMVKHFSSHLDSKEIQVAN